MKFEVSQRNCAMEEIMAMEKETFLWKLLCDSLPEFVRAKQGDDDYLSICRDSNHIGSDYVYVHCNRLRQMDTHSYRDYLFHEEPNEKIRKMQIRNLSMHLINKKSETEFKEAISKRELPQFEIATTEDDDYFEREIKIDERLKTFHREYLRVMDLDTYIEMIWTPLLESRLL